MPQEPLCGSPTATNCIGFVASQQRVIMMVSSHMIQLFPSVSVGNKTNREHREYNNSDSSETIYDVTLLIMTQAGKPDFCC